MERAFHWPATNLLDKIEGGFIKLDDNNQAIKVQKANSTNTNNALGSNC